MMEDYDKIQERKADMAITIIICIIIGTLFLSSCKSIRYVPVEKTVTETIEYHDTVTQVQLVPYRDSVAVQDTTSFLSNEYAYSWVQYSQGTLSHMLGIWPLSRITVTFPSYAVKTRVITQEKPVEVEKELTWWQQKKIDYAGLSMGINFMLTAILVWLIRKKGGSR